MMVLPTPAEALVTNLVYFYGAKFSVTNSGPNGEPRWSYEAAPGMQVRARTFLRGAREPIPGIPISDYEIIDAIRRLQKAEGHL